MHPLGEDSWKLVPGFLWSLPHMPFPFADFALYPLTVINYHCEHSYVTSHVNPSESWKLGVSGLEDPQYTVGSIHFHSYWGSTISSH